MGKKNRKKSKQTLDLDEKDNKKKKDNDHKSKKRKKRNHNESNNDQIELPIESKEIENKHSLEKEELKKIEHTEKERKKDLWSSESEKEMKQIIETKNSTDGLENDDLASSAEEGEEDKEEEKEEEENDEATIENDEEVVYLEEKNKSLEIKEKKEGSEEKKEGLITSSTFASLAVLKPICDAATLSGWKYATRIQKETLPHAFSGRDIIGLAETGSGKSGAFAIPVLQSLLKEKNYRRSIYAVVLAPTRELAFQIQDVFKALGSSIAGFTSVCIVGGVDMPSQAIALAKLPHVIIATPGRLLDHLQNTKGFTLRYVRYLVLDEADRMLSMDFEEELNQILAVMPDSSDGRKTMLFSATMTSKVEKLQRASLVNPVRIEVSTKFQTPETLLQYYLFIPAKYKDCYFTYLINECGNGKNILVFCSTCNNTQRLAYLLRNLGLNAICLHGQMSQPKRLGALHKFKSSQSNILICTDVASRGLDIPSVDAVINYDLPNHGKDYIHRVGRTARAGRSGVAYAIVTQYDVEVYQRLETLLGKRLPEYKLEEEVVLILLERVNEAQRLANKEMKEGRDGKDGRKKRKYEEDEEDGVEAIIQQEFKNKGFHRYAGGSSGRGGALPNQRGSRKSTKKYRH